MALRLLKGPVAMLGAGDDVAPSLVSDLQWYPNVGMLATILSASQPLSYRSIVAIDGKYFQVNRSSVSYSFGWYADVERPIIAVNEPGGVKEYTLEPHALVAEPVQEDTLTKKQETMYQNT